MAPFIRQRLLENLKLVLKKVYEQTYCLETAEANFYIKSLLVATQPKDNLGAIRHKLKNHLSLL